MNILTTPCHEIYPEKSSLRFLLLEGVHQTAISALRENGYENIESVPHSISDSELAEKITTVHFLGIRSRTHISEKILASAENLLAMGCFCIGTNQIDLQAATRKGIAVFNAPYANTRSVAELVLCHSISLLRGIPEKNHQMHSGIWKKSAASAYEIRGKTLGIIGYGNIGSQLSILAESLGMRVRFYDIHKKLPLGNARQINDMTKLLQQSDIVTLHVPEDQSTYQLIGEHEMNLMKPSAVLINLSRGNVVHLPALEKHLRQKKLAGAAIDVFPKEPESNKDTFKSTLTGLSNVILTPHIGGSTQEAQQNIGLEVAEKLIQYADNGVSASSVNFPEVSLPAKRGTHRILHVHKNIPGMLSAINTLFSDHSINIAGQYLQTNEQIGYVVTDINAVQRDQIFRQLSSIKGTLCCRVLY